MENFMTVHFNLTIISSLDDEEPGIISMKKSVPTSERFKHRSIICLSEFDKQLFIFFASSLRKLFSWK